MGDSHTKDDRGRRRSGCHCWLAQQCAGGHGWLAQPCGGRAAVAVGLILALLFLPGLTGCSGCRKDPAQAQKEKEEEEARLRAQQEKPKPKPDFEISRLAAQPFEGRLGGKDNPFSAAYKPGHWTAVSLAAKTNNFDFHGELHTSACDRVGRPVRLLGSTYDLTVSRTVALSKGEAKLLDTVLFVPEASEAATGTFRLGARRGGRTIVDGGVQFLARMPSYQYFFVVLSGAPARYAYLESLPSIKPPEAFVTDSRQMHHYRVVLVAPARRLPLPSHPLLWTSTAFVLWDDLAPDRLTPEQQDALVDWLHWGGQLIVSGPDTLDTLRDSFLADYLPADSGGAREYGADALEPLERWTVGSDRRLNPARPWSGVALQPRPGAEYVGGTGELLVERRVGRGRVVASAFRLSGRELTSWPGFDCFFNACVLRRPPRRFIESERTLGVEVQWADGAGAHRYDAALNTALRYFSRDFSSTPASAFRRYGRDAAAMDAELLDQPPPAPGMAAWNDFGSVSLEARKTLEAAAQIKIPRREFVVWIVAGYLLVLVPLNWLVFRAMGRVEWAWAAAPLIALFCTILVIQLAQLDIGFVRSQTEVAVVELQGNHPRAHVTRYTALYTSLATGYDFRFDDRGAVVLPIPEATDMAGYRAPLGARTRSVRHVLGEEARLEGFTVASNSVGMIHSEEMVALPGALRLEENRNGGLEVINGTGLHLEDARVIQKTAGGQTRVAWIGALAPGTREPVLWSRAAPSGGAGDGSGGPAGGAGGNPAARSGAPEPLPLGALVEFAAQASDLEPGEVRLAARTSGELPGLTIRPAAPQVRRAAVVVAHLQFTPQADPQPDKNAPKKLPEELEDLGT